MDDETIALFAERKKNTWIGSQPPPKNKHPFSTPDNKDRPIILYNGILPLHADTQNNTRRVNRTRLSNC
jgi:hypothetical protein